MMFLEIIYQMFHWACKMIFIISFLSVLYELMYPVKEEGVIELTKDGNQYKVCFMEIRWDKKLQKVPLLILGDKSLNVTFIKFPTLHPVIKEQHKYKILNKNEYTVIKRFPDQINENIKALFFISAISGLLLIF
jgi:hypothetical protein